MTSRRKFTREFKLKAVELSYQRESMKELAHELHVRAETLYRWRNEFAFAKNAAHKLHRNIWDATEGARTWF